MDACLGIPSIARDISRTLRVVRSSSYFVLSSGFSSSALSIVIPSIFGIAVAILSVSAYDTSSARPTSLTAALAFRVPSVIIWLTLSAPYFSITWSITSPRLSIQKSISISGMLTLSLFKNLSNMRLYLIGSISVICRQYATIEPAAEPLPGPTVIPFSRAYLMKSHTIRKYSTNPMLLITSSSLFSLESSKSA